VYLPITTREPGGSSWEGLRGRVQTVIEPERLRALAGVAPDPRECHVYLCGNPTMVEDMERELTERGFRKHTPRHPGNLHLEKYWTD
jgi:ferredoxin--NADP+ reductase